MRSTILFLILVSLSLIIACATKKEGISIQVKNTLDLERSGETIELSKSFLNLESLNNLAVKDSETNEFLASQLVDNDGDSIMDVLLFQPKIVANSIRSYQVVEVEKGKKPNAEAICFSRFVPERTDDYTWENDKVAFRVFGPDAQRRFENNLEEATLSSGVDAWLKKVEYPIINKWYKKHTEKTGSYHEDTGEGLDNFHVGKSRGVGGIAHKNDSTYYVSKNFTKWKTITTGPIRTSFYLEYDAWDAGGKLVKESRIINLDLGNNLSKFEITIESVDTISAGLTLHENDGEVTNDNKNSWISYWQPHADSELGTAIVTTPKYFSGYEKYVTDGADFSNAYIHLNVKNNKVIYYVGFTWMESDQFKDKQAWEKYLNTFSRKIRNPLKVEIIE